MGAACCVAARDGKLPDRSLGEDLRSYARNSPSWSFRRYNQCRMAGENEKVSRQPCQRSSMDVGTEIKSSFVVDRRNVSGGGTPPGGFATPTSQKSPLREGLLINSLTPSDAPLPSNCVTVVNNPTGSPEISEAASVKPSSSMSSPSSLLTSRSGQSGPSGFQNEVIQLSTTPSRQARRSPGHQLFRQISDSRILGFRSPNSNSLSERRPSFLLSTFGKDLTNVSQGGSSDGCSLCTFSEFVASSPRRRLSLDNEHYGSDRCKISGSSSRISYSPSIDLRTCGGCSKLLSERTSFVGDEIQVVAVLVCGHVYHAECLENMTPEANKYDPACPICTVGEKQVAKMARKALKAESEFKMRFHRKLKNRVMDSYFDNDLDCFKCEKNTFEREANFQKMEPSSSSKMSSGKPFFKQHFSKWIRSTSKNDSAKRKGLWRK